MFRKLAQITLVALAMTPLASLSSEARGFHPHHGGGHHGGFHHAGFHRGHGGPRFVRHGGRGHGFHHGYGFAGWHHGPRLGRFAFYPGHRHGWWRGGGSVVVAGAPAAWRYGYGARPIHAVGYGPGLGCHTDRHVGLAGYGLRKIVTVQTCIVP